jgi:predicted MFS family arabinose efflux permease
VGIILWGIFADKLVDRWPAIRFLTVALGILCCAPFGYWAFHSHSLMAIKFAEAGFGFFSAAVTSNLVSAMCDVIESRSHGFAIGILNLIGGVASGIGTFIGGVWMSSSGTAALMGFVAAVGVLTAVGLWLHVRATSFNRPAIPSA